MKYAKQYQANHIYQIRYQNSKDKDRYFRQHETELLLYNGAENMLKQYGISPKNIDPSKLQNEYKQLLSRKETLQKNYKSLEKEIKAFENKEKTMNQYLYQTEMRKGQDILD